MRGQLIALTVLAALAGIPATGAEDDPFGWLEEVEGERALAWVGEQNARTLKELQGVPEFQPIFERALEILDSSDRIPMPRLYGSTVYNLWKDERNPRGLWRRTTMESYRTNNPEWETVLDLDALAAADDTPWVFKGANCLPPDHRRCLVSLSRGGADATVVREFDSVTRSFVADGFFLPEAKSAVTWRDVDSVWVGTDFGEGSLTTSGYPRVVKVWRRGTPLAEARTVFEGLPTDVSVGAMSLHTPEGRFDVVYRTPVFYRQETLLMLGERLVKVAVPMDAEFRGIFKDHLLISLRSDWATGDHTYPAGSLIATAMDDLLRDRRRWQVLFTPAERVSLASVATTRDRVLVMTLDNVRSRLAGYTLRDGAWQGTEIALPGLGSASVTAASDVDDLFFLSYQDFLTPSSLWLAAGQASLEQVKTTPAFFDTTGMNVQQLEATSPDGTRIPYFLVSPKGFTADGTAPTLLYGYGGFQVPQRPVYSALRGTAWLTRGGVFVLANIRGGGEFGPRWHQAALQANRMKSFEDFIAVAEDLVARRITSPKHLGIMGGSQGGLLVGGAFTMRPDLFGAVVSQVPLADMQRFSKLLAGASWMAEYGNPDVPEQWEFIRTWSPYHLLRRDVTYPVPLYWTTTRDDRVHPGHARKMVARMQSLGHGVYYYEIIEGGHGAGSVNSQTARTGALEYAYLLKMLRP